MTFWLICLLVETVSLQSNCTLKYITSWYNSRYKWLFGWFVFHLKPYVFRVFCRIPIYYKVSFSCICIIFLPTNASNMKLNPKVKYPIIVRPFIRDKNYFYQKFICSNNLQTTMAMVKSFPPTSQTWILRVHLYYSESERESDVASNLLHLFRSV